MTELVAGQALPAVPVELNIMAVIAANVATLDFFPGLIDADYARSVGHRTIFLNTMTLLAIIDRYVLDWAPGGRVKTHEVVMRKPAYAGMPLIVTGTIGAVAPFAGSALAGAGREVEAAVDISGEGEIRATGKVIIVLP